MEDIRKSKEKLKRGNQSGETNHEGLWTPGNNLRVSEGRGLWGWGILVMGIKEGTGCNEHWVLDTHNESWNATSNTNDVLYGD